jgi:hypothetical protein
MMLFQREPTQTVAAATGTVMSGRLRQRRNESAKVRELVTFPGQQQFVHSAFMNRVFSFIMCEWLAFGLGVRDSMLQQVVKWVTRGNQTRRNGTSITAALSPT